MSSDDETTRMGEIVIIRRKAADDAAAGKGGAWKIAYADFVTAMMAFFLVMWLINASNEATRAQVASYFNPIKLTDSSTGNRGVKERKERKSTDSQSEEQSAATEGEKPSDDAAHEAAIMADPVAALEKIAAEASHASEGGATRSDSSASSRSSQMVEGVGDPFDPRSWEKIEAAPTPPPKAHAAEAKPEDATSHDPAPEHTPPPEPEPKAEPEPETEHTPEPKAEPAPAAAATETHAPEPPKEAAAEPVTEPAPEPARPVGPSAHEQLASEIARDIAEKLGTGLDQLPAMIDVKAVNDGVLISLTDKANFGMFKTGSAEPEPQLLQLVEAVARALEARDGFIVIRGHTDSRPYRNKRYDNWQLSTARAHFAQYMLVRGGLAEGRIRRIEGMADREPRVADDPEAAANRRIEILLGVDRP